MRVQDLGLGRQRGRAKVQGLNWKLVGEKQKSKTVARTSGLAVWGSVLQHVCTTLEGSQREGALVGQVRVELADRIQLTLILLSVAAAVHLLKLANSVAALLVVQRGQVCLCPLISVQQVIVADSRPEHGAHRSEYVALLHPDQFFERLYTHQTALDILIQPDKVLLHLCNVFICASGRVGGRAGQGNQVRSRADESGG
jgi:hypothetical protein